MLSYRIRYVRLQGVLELAAAIASTRRRRPNKTTSTERKFVPPAFFETGLNTRDWPVILAYPCFSLVAAKIQVTRMV
jgi:hypothetical protein